MKTIKPFAEQGNYIAVHQILFDEVMPNLSPTAWKVLCLIIRQTVGWHKERDQIAYSQIMEGTGIRNRNTVSRALQELRGRVPIIENGKVIQWLRVDTMPVLILAVKGAKRDDKTFEPTFYSLNSEVELLQSTKNVPGS